MFKLYYYKSQQFVEHNEKSDLVYCFSITQKFIFLVFTQKLLLTNRRLNGRNYLFKKWANPGLFSFIFVLFTFQFK